MSDICKLRDVLTRIEDLRGALEEYDYQDRLLVDLKMAERRLNKMLKFHESQALKEEGE